MSNIDALEFDSDEEDDFQPVESEGEEPEKPSKERPSTKESHSSSDEGPSFQLEKEGSARKRGSQPGRGRGRGKGRAGKVGGDTRSVLVPTKDKKKDNNRRDSSGSTLFRSGRRKQIFNQSSSSRFYDGPLDDESLYLPSTSPLPPKHIAAAPGMPTLSAPIARSPMPTGQMALPPMPISKPAPARRSSGGGAGRGRGKGKAARGGSTAATPTSSASAPPMPLPPMNAVQTNAQQQLLASQQAILQNLTSMLQHNPQQNFLLNPLIQQQLFAAAAAGANRSFFPFMPPFLPQQTNLPMQGSQFMPPQPLAPMPYMPPPPPLAPAPQQPVALPTLAPAPMFPQQQQQHPQMFPANISPAPVPAQTFVPMMTTTPQPPVFTQPPPQQPNIVLSEPTRPPPPQPAPPTQPQSQPQVQPIQPPSHPPMHVVEEPEEPEQHEDEGEEDDGGLESFLEEQTSSPIEQQQPAKSKLEAVWAEMQKTARGGPPSRPTTGAGPISVLQPQQAPTTVTETLVFAGETFNVERAASPTDSKKRTAGLSSLDDILSGMKRKKVTTLQKSHIDWTQFKKKEGIEDELEQFKKDGFLEKKAFLDRVEHRTYEKELEAKRR